MGGILEGEEVAGAVGEGLNVVLEEVVVLDIADREDDEDEGKEKEGENPEVFGEEGVGGC